MNDLDTTPDGAGPNPAARQMAALAAKVEDALSRRATGMQGHVDGTRERMAGYVADPSTYDEEELRIWLTLAVGAKAAHDVLGMKPPRRGLVYCCSSEGWVTPAEHFDHVWDSWSSMNDD